MAITGPVTSSIALRLASRGDRPVAISRSTFSTTTIASSTTMPIASTSPNSERLLSEKPNNAMTGERADERHRHGHHGDDRRPPVLQEHQHDDEHQDKRLDQRVVDARDRLLNEHRRVVDDPYSMPSGKLRFSSSIFSRIASAVARALEPGSWNTASVTEGWPSR